MADGHICHRNFFKLYGPWVNEITTGKHYLRLQTTVTVIREEGIDVLEVIMAFDHFTGYLSGPDWFTIERGYNAYHVFPDDDHIGNGYTKCKTVDAIRTCGEQCCLPTFLTIIHKKFFSILEVITVYPPSQNITCW